MKKFIENTLHKKVEITKYEKEENLPLILRGNFELYSMEIYGHKCLLAEVKEEAGLVSLRKQQRRLEQLTGLYCVLYLKHLNYYSRDKMLEEGIAFIWDERQIYMPFLGILLTKNETRELKPCAGVSFLTQKLLLKALYEGWDEVTVTKAAEYLNVTKTSITRCFDEIECLEIPVLKKRGRSRILTGFSKKKEMWDRIKQYMRNPLIREFRLAEDMAEDMVKSGITALAEYSMLADNDYPTYAITKSELKKLGMETRKQVPKEGIPGCIVQELGYMIVFDKEKAIDPLTVCMLLKNEKEEPRVGIALDEMLEESVW